MATWDAPPVLDQGNVVTIDGTAIEDTTIDLGPGTNIVVADEATMHLYELSAAERTQLGDTGALLLSWWTLPWIGEDVMVWGPWRCESRPRVARSRSPSR